MNCLLKVCEQYHFIDIFTKPLDVGRFENRKTSIGVCSIDWVCVYLQ